MKSLPLLFLFTVLLFPGVAHAIYNPTEGRWMSRDPIQEAGGLNFYAYVDNDPIDETDPLGLFASDPKWDFEAARKAGADADLRAAESADRNHNGKGAEASGLVCKICQNGKDLYGFTGPNLGEVVNSGHTRTRSNQSKEPCPAGWATVGIHYAHPSGAGIPPYDTGIAKSGSGGTPPNMPLILATPVSPITPHNPYPAPTHTEADPPDYSPHPVP